jgi:hypothetical protein
MFSLGRVAKTARSCWQPVTGIAQIATAIAICRRLDRMVMEILAARFETFMEAP